MSSAGIVPPTVTTTSLAPLISEQLHHPRDQSHVCTREDREPNGVGVLLDRGLGDLLRRLVQAGVDHLHARVAQGARDDLRAAVVPIQSGLGDDDPDFSGGLGRHYSVRAVARAAS